MEGLLKTDIPSKLTGSRHNLPWINTELKRQIRKKGRRFSKPKKSGLKEDWDNYKAIEKDVKCNLKRAETNFFTNHFDYWTRIRGHQAFLEVCEVSKARTFWYNCSSK